MARATQKRTLETRARLITASEEIIDEVGYAALRVEEVVLRAGTAKGTFFAHFKDKDALMDLIIGKKLNAYIDQLETQSAPKTVEDMVQSLIPLCEFMSCERYAFDVILRYSGAAAIEEIGPIAMTFGRLPEVLAGWLTKAPYRNDVPVDLLAEGIHSFMLQAVATHFCALHNSQSTEDRLLPYLKAWLTPGNC